MTSRGATSAGGVCFNGAASLKTRKLETNARQTKIFTVLQWGRVPEDAEMRSATACRWRSTGFNGAASLKTRK